MTLLARLSLSSIAVASLVAASLTLAPAAGAAESAVETSPSTSPGLAITHDQLESAIEEARDLGYVASERTTASGDRITTLDLGKGFSFDLIDRSTAHSRLGASQDLIGKYVSFNALDQNMIISGAALVLGAGLCVVSAGIFCVIAGAIITAATVAITGNGAIRCGTKSLRVYPFASHKPRCA